MSRSGPLQSGALAHIGLDPAQPVGDQLDVVARLLADLQFLQIVIHAAVQQVDAHLVSPDSARDDLLEDLLQRLRARDLHLRVQHGRVRHRQS